MKILIVEDITLVAERIMDLSKIFFEQCDVAIVYCLHDAIEYLSENSIDLLFLDLNINGESGFELLKLAVASSFHTIVITATPEKASLAFDYGVLDFITKPISQERFSLAADRFYDNNFVQREKLKHLSIKLAGVVQLIPIESIDFIKASGNYSEINTSQLTCLLHDKSTDKLLKMLPNNFIRIHRSYIVQQDKIQKIIKKGAGQYCLQLVNGIKLPLSRTIYKERFK
jgi:two-component system response regulator LytT